MSTVRFTARHCSALALAALAFVALVTPATTATASPRPAVALARVNESRPATYIVSEEPGVLPEGIGTSQDGRTFYVSSFGTGAIYTGSTGQARLRLFAAAGDAGRTSARGVHVDRQGHVYVAGSSALDVYDADGTLLAHRPAPAGTSGDPFLNDLVITRDAVYVTDSVNAVVYRAALMAGVVGPLMTWFNAMAFQPAYPSYYWYLNGIVASTDGRRLLVAAQGIGALIRIETRTASGSFLEQHGVNLGADGLLVSGNTVYAVLNYEPPVAGVGVYQARLSHNWREIRLVTRLPDSGLLDPTTVAMDDRGRLLVVNSQLEHQPGTPPWTVTALERRPRW